MQHMLAVCIVLFLCVRVSAGGQDPTNRPSLPTEPVAALLDAFRTHDIVALTDPHGSEQVQTLLLSLIRDPRFPATVNDIVIEAASVRYQDAIDRFVRGDDVSREALRKAWDEHTVPNNLGVHAEEILRAVRAINASLAVGQRVRVLAGDPPIDWPNIVSRQDHFRWIELRDSSPADVIRRQVLDRGRRALVIYGQGHLQRAQIEINYDMSTWQSQTLVSLLERDPTVRLFNVWTLRDSGVPLPDGVTSWPTPSLSLLRGTTLGARDFGTFSRGLGNGGRVGFRNGQLAPIPRTDWKAMRMEDQFDALLYLGSPESFTNVAMPASLCQDSTFIANRIERLGRFAPPVEAESLRKSCGLRD